MRQINLLPAELQKAEANRPIITSAVVGVIAIIAAVSLVHFLLAARVNRLDRIANQPTITKKDPKIIQLRQDIAKVKLEKQKLVEGDTELFEILSQDLPYPYLLKTIANVTSNRVWLSKIYVDSTKEICQIDGNSFNTQMVSEFMFDLKKSALFENVTLSSVEKMSASEKKDVKFRVNCSLK